MRSPQKLLIALAGVLILSNSTSVLAEGASTAIGRYLVVPNQPLSNQADPLKQIVEVRFPPSVVTIREAMQYLLRFSGYQLVADKALIPEVQNLLRLPLPRTDRLLGPMALQDGVLTLAGKPFGLIVDPVHRLLDFRVLPAYAPLYQTKIVTNSLRSSL